MKILTQLILIAMLCLQQAAAQIFINEVQTSNEATIVDNFLEADDWIELYNPTNAAINLAGYFISDDSGDLLQHQIIAGDPTLTTVPANGYLLLWADKDEEQGVNHLNFKLKTDGETIYLTSPDQVSLIDSLEIPLIAKNESYFRKPDGSNNVFVSPTPTPQTSNNAVTLYLSEPVISLPTGKYNSTQTISITADSGATIYYTTNGSTPTTNSPVYNGAFNIDASTTVKAFAVQPGFIDSKMVYENYLYGATSNLSIVNLSIDPTYLFDDEIGMYAEGTNGIIGPCMDTEKNWWQDWQYEATVTLYEKDGTTAFNEACGIEISGGCSRNNVKKSFNVKFKGAYGKKSLNYKLFEDSEVDIFDGFKLRSGGSQSSTRRIPDVITQQIIQDQFDVDLQHSRPIAMYINGDYWGLYHLRDRVNSGYLQSYHPKVDNDNVDIIKFPNADGSWLWWSTQSVSEGDDISYNNMRNFAINNDLSIDANYQKVVSQLDLNELMNYLVANIYQNNGDWPENNIKVWKEKTDKGKWRWLLYDTEHMVWRGAHTNVDVFDEFMNETDPTERRNPEVTKFYRSLFANKSFKNEFVQRMNTYIHTVWNYNRTNAIFQDIKAEVAPEIEPDFTKWGGWDFNQWNTEIDKMDVFFRDRPSYARTMVKNVLSLGNEISLNLNFNANSLGSVVMHQNFFEVPNNFSANYFSDSEMWIHAVPKPGHRFVEWKEISDNDKYKQNIYKKFSSNKTLTPVFEPALDLVISEIFYNPAGKDEDEEFIELYNPDDKAKSLWGYQFTNGVQFTFPENSFIQPGEYIIVAHNDSTYVGNGYQVFEWECGSLSNDGEAIVFSNPTNAVIDSVYYNDNDLWNQNADGEGFSLALLNDVADNNLPTSWNEQILSSIISPGRKNDFCGFGTPCDDGNPNTINEAYDTNCNCAVPEPSCNNLINFENFESNWGIWNDGGADASRINNSTYAASGNFSAAIQDNTNSSVITTNNLNLSTYTEVEINFNYFAVSMDNSNEDFWLQISTNGGSSFNTVQQWAKTTNFNNNTAYSESVNIEGPFTSNTKLRFRCDASGNADDVYIDDIEIMGCSSGGGNNCATVGQSCTDNDACTTNDTYDANCNCVGTASGDLDNDGICDAIDTTNGNCLLNAICDDGDPCTSGETYDANCNCNGGSPVANNSSETLTPTDDTFIRGGSYGNSNYGNSTTLHIKKAGNDKWTRNAYLKFDVSSVNGSQLQNATLRVKVATNNNGNVAQELLKAPNDNWTESNLTWNNNQFGGTSLSNFTVVSAGQWVEIEVTNAVLTEANGDDMISFAIVSNNNKYIRYHSKESNGNQPQLVLTYQSCNNNKLGKIDDEAIKVFPNPCLDYINIEINESIKEVINQISIYSVACNLVQTISDKLNNSIYVGDLTPGLYIIQAESATKKMNSKFIKQ